MTREQLPLQLAWAITIHKSQGDSLDTAVIDIGKSELACGCTYVAWSRLRKINDCLAKPYDKNRYLRLFKTKAYKSRIEEEKRLNQIALKEEEVINET